MSVYITLLIILVIKEANFRLLDSQLCILVQSQFASIMTDLIKSIASNCAPYLTGRSINTITSYEV